MKSINDTTNTQILKTNDNNLEEIASNSRQNANKNERSKSIDTVNVFAKIE